MYNDFEFMELNGAEAQEDNGIVLFNKPVRVEFVPWCKKHEGNAIISTGGIKADGSYTILAFATSNEFNSNIYNHVDDYVDNYSDAGVNHCIDWEKVGDCCVSVY